MLAPEAVQKFRAVFSSVKTDEPMSAHTNFRIGGPAALFLTVAKSEQLVQVIALANELEIPWYMMGGGSNLLVSDDGFNGLVIQMAARNVSVEGDRIRAEAGALTSVVAKKSVEAKLAGFEWAIGVPGTLGGALYGNAGCFGGETSQAVVSVEALRLSDGQSVTLSQADCQFGYRESVFKREPHVILNCVIKLEEVQDNHPLLDRIDHILKQRREKQPLENSSAGCIFKNYEFKDDGELDILKRQIDVIPASMLQNKSLSAGWLIDQVGMTGQTVGEAQVSPKHGNFFLNLGHARAQDVLALISLVKMKVRDELGIELQEEVQLLGF